jgi:hypothetical protein
MTVDSSRAGLLVGVPKDIDLLGHVANEIDRIVAIVKKVCRQEVEPDGMDCDPDSVRGERIAEEAESEGVRARFRGAPGTAEVGMQIDVGFGDAVVSGPETAKKRMFSGVNPACPRRPSRLDPVSRPRRGGRRCSNSKPQCTDGRNGDR